jgi:hypothetical protein
MSNEEAVTRFLVKLMDLPWVPYNTKVVKKGIPQIWHVGMLVEVPQLELI